MQNFPRLILKFLAAQRLLQNKFKNFTKNLRFCPSPSIEPTSQTVHKYKPPSKTAYKFFFISSIIRGIFFIYTPLLSKKNENILATTFTCPAVNFCSASAQPRKKIFQKRQMFYRFIRRVR